MAIITIAMMAGMSSASGINSLVTGGATTGTNGQDIAVTIEATSMSNVGSLQLNLIYDKNVITASSATTGGMTSGSLFASNIDNVAGKVSLGWVSTTGISGTGTLVTIKFHVVGSRGAKSPLDIHLADITDPNSGSVTIRPKITNGIFNIPAIQKAAQTITFGALVDKKITDPPFVVSATASSGLPVSFSIVTGPATISGNKITISGIGTGPVTVRASQAGNSVYNAAPNVDRIFKIVGSISSITVTSPNGGEKWKHGTTHVLHWKSVGNPGANVKIELLKGTVTKTIISSAKNNGSYSWKIPVSQTPGTNYKIRITSATNKAYTDTSNKNFNITT